jgi:hypothetical protein
MQRLGKNLGAYFGESIEIAPLLEACAAAAKTYGWLVDPLPLDDETSLYAFIRPATKPPVNEPPRRIYISAGIHGDEPAGPLAVLRLLTMNQWPEHLELRLLPCLNPTGFPINKRENARGTDLNRDYRHFESAEVRAHVEWLKRQPDFYLTLCLHEDWESHGFYLYELNPEHRLSLSQIMVDAVSPVCPIDFSPEIEGRAAQGGIISPNLDPNSRPQWPEAFWLIQNRTRQSYTLEAPSDFPLSTRVDALVAAVLAALARL